MHPKQYFLPKLKERLTKHMYGIADASAYYFDKTPDALTRNQAVFLATLTPAPYRLRPLEDPFTFARERNGSL